MLMLCLQSTNIYYSTQEDPDNDDGGSISSFEFTFWQLLKLGNRYIYIGKYSCILNFTHNPYKKKIQKAFILKVVSFSVQWQYSKLGLGLQIKTETRSREPGSSSEQSVRKRHN